MSLTIYFSETLNPPIGLPGKADSLSFSKPTNLTRELLTIIVIITHYFIRQNPPRKIHHFGAGNFDFCPTGLYKSTEHSFLFFSLSYLWVVHPFGARHSSFPHSQNCHSLGRGQFVVTMENLRRYIHSDTPSLVQPILTLF
ncbi:uncharacterized protein PV06_03940 [Exophiala oligosperma]|uniref:Uncharacterized protein n=1 Tax=Exophiala oligosperma TaxID=215243 RepID=A0A0D2EC87_9EURO|nr:uncharacterized protein PV06_03940 [Exophiala oligosperma]KIW45559.1 hypothetical protein PV06_03940 [Exophiala oligosperma]